MKHLFLTIAAALIATAANAQIVSSTSRSISEVKTVSRGWNELNFGVDFGSFDVDDGDGFNFTTLSLGWAKAIQVSNSTPLFLRPGAALQYSFWSDGDDEEKVTGKWLSVAPTCDFGYLFTPSSSISIFPYVGLTTRFNIWGEEKYESDYYDEEESYDLFDSDEGDCKRFQIGWRIGCDFHFSRFILGVGYGMDFNEFAEDTKISSFNVKAGIKF